MRVRYAILASAAAMIIAVPGPARAQAETVAAQPEAQAAPQSDAGPKPPEPSRPDGVDLLPLINVITFAEGADISRTPVGGYVRFYACEASQCQGTGLPSTAQRRRYVDEHRNWLSRWLIGRSFSRILTVKLAIARPNISATATLAASVLQSNRSVGETWDSEVNGRRYLTPYLRVDPDTVVSVDVDMNAATAVQANISGAVLNVVSRAVQLVQPTGQLVTSLNSERLRQTSEFVDQSVSALFAQNLAESSSNQFAPEEWASKTLVEINARFPMNRRLLRHDEYRNVGTWRVRATEARVSMFSERGLYPLEGETGPDTCNLLAGTDLQACRAFAGLTPQRVLGVAVDENLTLGEALLADTAISAEITRLLGATAAADEAQAGNRLCALVAAKAESLGFNRYDATAAVWALSQQAQLEGNREHLMGTSAGRSLPSCSAAALAAAVKLS